MTNISQFRAQPRETREAQIAEAIAATMRRMHFPAPIAREFERRAMRLVSAARQVIRGRVAWQEWPEAQTLAPEVLEAARPLLERIEREAMEVGFCRAIHFVALPEILSHVCTLHGTPPPDWTPDDNSGGTAA